MPITVTTAVPLTFKRQPAPAFSCMVRIGGRNRNWLKDPSSLQEVTDAFEGLTGGAAPPCKDETERRERVVEKNQRIFIRQFFKAGSLERYRRPLLLKQQQ